MTDTFRIADSHPKAAVVPDWWQGQTTVGRLVVADELVVADANVTVGRAFTPPPALDAATAATRLLDRFAADGNVAHRDAIIDVLRSMGAR